MITMVTYGGKHILNSRDIEEGEDEEEVETVKILKTRTGKTEVINESNL